LSFDYTPAFTILEKAVRKTNSSKIQNVARKAEQIFEQQKKVDHTLQTDCYEPYRSILLRG